MADVKVRLGSINSAGQQKGVDSLLVTDMIDLARNQAIADAAIVTGDGDMRVAVQIAQSFGVRVHLIGLEPSRASQSALLRQEADTVHEISKTDVARFMKHSAPVLPPATIQLPTLTPAPGSNVLFEDAVSRAIHQVLQAITGDDLDQLRQAIAAANRIPEVYDRRILGTCGVLLKRPLNEREKRSVRDAALIHIQNMK